MKATIKRARPQPPPDDEANTEETAEETSTPKKKKRAANAGAQLPPSAHVSPFGAIPHGATHWGLRRVTAGGSLEVLSAVSPDGLLEVSEWPLDELSADTILSRWGEGHYKVQWLGPTPRGGRAMAGWGREFRVHAPPMASAPAAAAPPPSPGLPATHPLADALQLFGVIQQSANQQAQMMLSTISTIMAAGAGQNQQIAQLTTVMQQQQQQIAALAARGIERDVEDEGDDDDEDDDDEGDEEAGGDGGPFAPGVNAIDTAKAAALNALWSKAPDIVESVVALLMSAKTSSEAPRALTPAPANGVSTTSSTSPKPESSDRPSV